MSVVERSAVTDVPADLVEVTARRGRARDLANIARVRGLDLPPVGRATFNATHVVLSVRPDRWFIMGPAQPPGDTASQWKRAFGPLASVIDQSSGYAIFDLTSAHACAALARSCRLDLDERVFSIGHAAATSIAQVQTCLVPHPAGLLVLTPASTSRHFSEWFAHVCESLDTPPPGASSP